jgi:histone H3/H4
MLGAGDASFREAWQGASDDARTTISRAAGLASARDDPDVSVAHVVEVLRSYGGDLSLALGDRSPGGYHMQLSAALEELIRHAHTIARARGRSCIENSDLAAAAQGSHFLSTAERPPED